jgi:hypothetical protein
VGLVTAGALRHGLGRGGVAPPIEAYDTIQGEVLKRDHHRDLAILDNSEIPLTEYFELESASMMVAVGDTVTSCGYPYWAPGDRLNPRPGHVSLLTPKGGVRKIELRRR